MVTQFPLCWNKGLQLDAFLFKCVLIYVVPVRTWRTVQRPPDLPGRNCGVRRGMSVLGQHDAIGHCQYLNTDWVGLRVNSGYFLDGFV